jgi:glucosyl-dolichyl phosphate glucuronosyltransferase
MSAIRRLAHGGRRLIARDYMRLDVILPTHNRSALLARALDSLLVAEAPPRLQVRVTVVDNNSTDDTAAIVQSRVAAFRGRLSYLFEPRPGKPYALNTGIASTSGDLVGLIDDDEEIEAGWYRCIDDAFQDRTLDYLGGRCLPRWAVAPPAWFGRRYRGVIGWVECGTEPLDFGPDFPGILTGGNAVLTRAVLQRVGPYAPSLSRTPKRLMGAEDEQLYRRLLLLGAKGRYRPDLIIYHYVPEARLTKPYFRRWCFWCGVSRGVIDREYPLPVPYLAGVPRYLFGQAGREALRSIRGAVTGSAPPEDRFASELNLWDLAGFLYGKHFYRTPPAQAPGRGEAPDVHYERRSA